MTRKQLFGPHGRTGESLMKTAGLSALAAALWMMGSPANATGLATCDSGPQSGWKPQETLQKRLTDEGWQVRRIKVDGGCYEVYAIDSKGKRVEAYFHPVTLASVPTKAR